MPPGFPTPDRAPSRPGPRLGLPRPGQVRLPGGGVISHGVRPTNVVGGLGVAPTGPRIAPGDIGSDHPVAPRPIVGPRPQAAPHPAARPVAPAQPGQPAQPAQPAQPTGNDSLDSTYFGNVAANQFKVNNEVNALNLQGSQANVGLQSTLAQLNYQQPRDSLKLEQAANNRGALYSTVYGQDLGNLGYSFLGRQGAAQNKFASTQDTLAARIAALQQGVPIYNEQQALASATRASNLALKDPTLGQGTGGLNTTPGQVTAGSQRGINRNAKRAAARPAVRPAAPPKLRPSRLPKAIVRRRSNVVNVRPVSRPAPVARRQGPRPQPAPAARRGR